MNDKKIIISGNEYRFNVKDFAEYLESHYHEWKWKSEFEKMIIDEEIPESYYIDFFEYEGRF